MTTPVSGPADAVAHARTRTEHEVLKAIWRTTRTGSPAHTVTLAEDLDRSPATVSETVKRLAARGLVDHCPYRSVELTPEGRTVALAAIRRHRLLERFLVETLGFEPDRASDLARDFEHELPDEVEARLEVVLGHPPTCPHGEPIPPVEPSVVPPAQQRTTRRPPPERLAGAS